MAEFEAGRRSATPPLAMSPETSASSIRLRLLHALRRLSAAAPSLREARRRRTRRRRVVLVSLAVAVSLAVNLALILSLRGLWLEEGDGAEPGTAREVAFVPEIPEAVLEVPPTTVVVPTAKLPSPGPISDDPLPAASEVSEVPLEVAAESLGPALAGPSLDSAGTGGTTFFGVTARGRRIGYVVDVSASMESGGRIWLALGELKRSLAGLPDFAWFYVTLFSNELLVPPFQRSWQRAVPTELTRMDRWIDSVSTRGGTRPGPAFERLFSLDPKPDAIFFLTDGEVPADTPALVRRLNDRIRPTVINTVAFGSEAGRAALEEMARDSDGVFRFVPTGGRP